MTPALHCEIERLRKLTLEQLQHRYRELFPGATRSSSRSYLVRRIGWRLQAAAAGGLSQVARQRAAQLIRSDDLVPQNVSAIRPRDPRLPAIGTVLHRIYQGRSISVTVRARGFEYNSQIYTSLSAIAQQVSGMRWNGFSFFGLQPAHSPAEKIA